LPSSRAKDVGKLADGTPFAPQFIENKLKFSPYIREAVAFGNQRPFVMNAIDIPRSASGANAQPLLHELLTGPQPEVAQLIVDEDRDQRHVR
jgi:long-chain acyl-CoA synthetase